MKMFMFPKNLCNIKYLIFCRMDVSHNMLLKIPSSSLSSLAALTLCELHLSNNFISTIHSMDLSNKFRVIFNFYSSLHLLKLFFFCFSLLDIWIYPTIICYALMMQFLPQCPDWLFWIYRTIVI